MSANATTHSSGTLMPSPPLVRPGERRERRRGERGLEREQQRPPGAPHTAILSVRGRHDPSGTVCARE